MSRRGVGRWAGDGDHIVSRVPVIAAPPRKETKKEKADKAQIRNPVLCENKRDHPECKKCVHSKNHESMYVEHGQGKCYPNQFDCGAGQGRCDRAENIWGYYVQDCICPVCDKSRIVKVGCNNEQKKLIGYASPDLETHVRIRVCGKCLKKIKNYDRIAKLLKTIGG